MLIFSLILLRNAMLLGNMFRISWNCKKMTKSLMLLKFCGCSSNDKTTKPSDGTSARHYIHMYLRRDIYKLLCHPKARGQHRCRFWSGAPRRRAVRTCIAVEFRANGGCPGTSTTYQCKGASKISGYCGIEFGHATSLIYFLPVKLCIIASW